MPRFAIYAREVLVGHSHLEHGDPPMGVASGLLDPAPGYSIIRDECIANHADQSHLGLTVQADGATIACVAVAILDFDNGPDGIEVNALGIPHPEYATLFPEHVAAYARRFS